MSTLDDWLLRATDALDLPPDTIPADLRDSLLDLTRDVAHGVARIAGPLTCYLAGVAVGRGAAPSTVLAALTASVPAEDNATGSSKGERIVNWIGWIVFGALAGWVASLVLRDKRRGCLTNMITGILGAVLAGFIYQWTTGQAWTFGWDWASFGVACLGAIGLLLVITLVTGGSRRDEQRR